MKKEENKKNIEVEQEEVKKKKRPFISKLIILFLLVGLFYIYARYIGTSGIELKEYSITNETIPPSFDGFSIVQFSDLELGSTFNTENLESLVTKINDLKPDIVVFTGDIVKPGYTLSENEKRTLITYLDKIDPLIGKYSVRGDDDAYTEIYDEVMSKTNFKDISNTYELIYYKGLTPIVLYGLDSLNADRQNLESTFSYPPNEEDTTYMATFRILLAHEPDTYDKVSDYNISLMLSGHSHNSELNIPFIKEFYNIKGASKYYDESYKENGTELYISSGLGTSKHKVRLFAHPSISIYRLYTSQTK